MPITDIENIDSARAKKSTRITFDDFEARYLDEDMEQAINRRKNKAAIDTVAPFPGDPRFESKIGRPEGGEIGEADEGAKPLLGSITELVRGHAERKSLSRHENNDLNEKRRALFLAQFQAARLMSDTPHKRIGKCLKWIMYGETIVKFWRGQNAKGKAKSRMGNLVQCGYIWSCPCCSARISRERAKEMNHLLHHKHVVTSSCTMKLPTLTT